MKESTLHLVMRFGAHNSSVFVRIDSQDFIRKGAGNPYATWPETFQLFYIERESDKTLKEFKQNLCKKCLNYDFDEFCKIYDLFWRGSEVYDDNKKIWKDIATSAGIFEIKTHDGKIWYSENEKIIYDKKCTLLTFGYTRLLENEYNYNIPIPIKHMFINYYKENK